MTGGASSCKDVLALADGGLILGEVACAVGRCLERVRMRGRKEESSHVGQPIEGGSKIGRAFFQNRNTNWGLRRAAYQQVEMLEPLLVKGADAQIDARQ